MSDSDFVTEKMIIALVHDNVIHHRTLFGHSMNSKRNPALLGNDGFTNCTQLFVSFYLPF